MHVTAFVLLQSQEELSMTTSTERKEALSEQIINIDGQ